MSINQSISISLNALIRSDGDGMAGGGLGIIELTWSDHVDRTFMLYLSPCFLNHWLALLFIFHLEKVFANLNALCRSNKIKSH